MAEMRIVDRDGIEHRVDAAPGIRIMEILRNLDYGVAALCGGMCSCGTCHVHVAAEWAERLPPSNVAERELLAELPNQQHTSRLSCQVIFTENLSGIRLTIASDR
jgi:2Fe-2S ferredoxin